MMGGLPILLIDNYDSYTYNLYQLISVVNEGTPPIVIKNDDQNFSLDHLEARFSSVIISPGPGNPSNENVTKTSYIAS